MKNLVLASALGIGTLAGAFAAPVLSGPIHFQVTKPFSMFGWVPGSSGWGTPVSVTLGTVPMDFVLTHVICEVIASRILIKANGNDVLCAGSSGPNGYVESNLHLTNGVLIPAGSSVVVEVKHGQPITTPVTLAGYVQ